MGRRRCGLEHLQQRGTAAALYAYAETRKRLLPGAPDDIAGEVAQALDAIVYEGARVQQDKTLTPKRTMIGYPNGYNGGTVADGFGIQFQVNDGYADLSVYGHCVPGSVPKLGSSLNPRPTDLP